MTKHQDIGWYQDPCDSRRHRYWDGIDWLSQEQMAQMAQPPETTIAAVEPLTGRRSARRPGATVGPIGGPIGGPTAGCACGYLRA